MDKLLCLNIEQKSKNYYILKNNKKNIKLKINNILCPFGIDEEYGNDIFKFEFNIDNTEHLKLIDEIKNFENQLKTQFDVNDEWKSLIVTRENNNIFIEGKVKKIKNNLITKLVFENPDLNYLKTIYELKESFYCDLILEIPTLWDFRDNDNGKKNNKIGLILNIVSLKIH